MENSPSRNTSILLHCAVQLLLIFSSGCLLANNNDCPPIANTAEKATELYPACTGSLTPTFSAELPALPVPGNPLVTANSNVTLTRVTNNSSIVQKTKKLRHFYSRRQAWNLDESLLDLGSSIVNADTYESNQSFIPFSSERIWSNTNKNTMIGIRSNPKPIELSWYNFRLQEYELVHRFDQYETCTLGHGEGNLSNDDQLLVITCTDKQSNTDIISFDLAAKEILGLRRAAPNLNWASISPSGAYVVVENNNHPDPNPVLLRYSKFLENEVLLMNHPSHGDLTLDDKGQDVHVMISSNSVFYVRIEDRQLVKLAIGNRKFKHGSGHVSCRNLKRPGWCYLSSYYSGHVGAFKIGGSESAKSGLVKLGSSRKRGPNAYEHWGFHHSSSKSYRAQPKASVSPSGKKVIFSSDWQGQSSVEDYVLSLSS